MELLKKYQQIIINNINTYPKYRPQVESLYTPAHYALEGGKKIRPVMVLMAAEAFGSDPQQALPAALAIETFHNFTETKPRDKTLPRVKTFRRESVSIRSRFHRR